MITSSLLLSDACLRLFMLAESEESVAKKYGEDLLNLMLSLNLTAVDNQTRQQILQTLSLLIIATSD